MRLTIESKKLLRGLEVVKPVAGALNKIVPVCDNILIRSDNDCIALIATNINHSIITQIPCEVRGKINALIPFMDIYNICKGLTDQSLTISFGKDIEIKSANGSYKITGVDQVSDFPKVEVIIPEVETEIASSQIGQIQKRSIKFLHPDEANNKHWICFDFEKDVLNVVATNNNCLSLFKVPCNAKPKRYLLDKETINLIQIFSYSGGVSFKFSDKKIQVENSDTILISPLVDLSYPDFKQLILNTDCLIEVNRISLLNTLQRSIRFSMADLAMFSIGDNLNISSVDINYGKDFAETIDFEKMHGFPEDYKAMFNAKEIVEFLSSCTSETIKITGIEGKNMCYINEPDNDSVFLIMKYKP